MERRKGRQRQELSLLAALATLVVVSEGGGGGGAVVSSFPHRHHCSRLSQLRQQRPRRGFQNAAGARLRLRGGGDMSHLLPDVEESESSHLVDWEKLTEQEKKEYDEDKAYGQWKAEYMENLTFCPSIKPYTKENEQSVFERIKQQKKLQRLLKKAKLDPLRSNRGPKAVFEDENGERKSLIDGMDPTHLIPRDELNDVDSSEDTPLPDPRDKEATMEYMFEKILDMQRKNEDDQRFEDNEEEDLLNANDFTGPNPKLHRRDRNEAKFERERQYADHIIDAPFEDSDGVLHNITGSSEDFLNRHGIFSLPLTLGADFHTAKKENEPTAETALEAWEMFKGKDLEGFDTICLRHKMWGTEVEFFIGSIGTFKCRPSPLHQITTVEVDGSWFEWTAHHEKMEAPHIFEHLWDGYNITDDMSNLWRKGARDWVEAMGGADSYLYQEQEITAPTGAEAIDIAAVKSDAGWIPCQDRWADFDLLNTTYIRPRKHTSETETDASIHTLRENPDAYAPKEDEEPLVRRACAPLQGAWCARLVGSRVVWTNKHNLCELHLTPEGFIFLSDWDQWKGHRPSAVRVEYGMAGCVDGVNVLYNMSNMDARRTLGLAEPTDKMALERLEKAHVADQESAAAKLYAWCKDYGWHSLQRRLFERGRDADEVFNWMMKEARRINHQASVLEEDLPYTDTERDIYTMPCKLGLRKLKFVGVGEYGLPEKIVDIRTKEVVWNRDQKIKLDFPWASKSLRIQHAQAGSSGMRNGGEGGRSGENSGGGVTQIFDKSSGMLIVEFNE